MGTSGWISEGKLLHYQKKTPKTFYLKNEKKQNDFVLVTKVTRRLGLDLEKNNKKTTTIKTKRSSQTTDKWSGPLGKFPSFLMSSPPLLIISIQWSLHGENNSTEALPVTSNTLGDICSGSWHNISTIFHHILSWSFQNTRTLCPTNLPVLIWRYLCGLYHWHLIYGYILTSCQRQSVDFGLINGIRDGVIVTPPWQNQNSPKSSWFGLDKQSWRSYGLRIRFIPTPVYIRTLGRWEVSPVFE